MKAIASKSAANSVYSEVKSGICKRTKLETPEVKGDIVNGKPKLTWDVVSGAKGYEIYRAVNPLDKFVYMKTTTTTVYSNSSASNGVTYYYIVRAIGETEELSSDYSEVCSIEVPASESEQFVTAYVVPISIKIYQMPSDLSEATEKLEACDLIIGGLSVTGHEHRDCFPPWLDDAGTPCYHRNTHKSQYR